MNRRHLKPTSLLAKKFIEFYLDPSLSPNLIMKKLSISKATYYRLCKDSEINTINVGLLTELDSPTKSRVHWDPEGLQSEGSKTLRKLSVLLSKNLSLRFNVIFLTISDNIKYLKSNKIDISISDLTFLPGRFDHANFTHPYILNGSPMGVIYSTPKMLSCKKNTRLILGVIKESLHHNYAQLKLADQFQIRAYLSAKNMNAALKLNKIEALFTHPTSVKNDFHLVPCGPPIYFGGHTGIAVSGKHHQLLEDLNKSLEKLESLNLLSQIQYK